MNKQQYEAEKARLKAKRKRLREKLEQCNGPAYASAVEEYTQCQEELEGFYREHCGPQKTRAERRIEKLRSKGIKPVWD